jgi:hypothetical protein
MADRFVDYETKICADWLNTVDDAVFDALGSPATPEQARSNIGAVEEAPKDSKPYVRVNASWQSTASSLLHNDLGGRDSADAHSQGAITGLNGRLADIEAKNAAQDARDDSQDAAIAARITDAPSDGSLYARRNSGWAAFTVPTAITVHNDLTGRSAADAHPQSAVTGLEARLSSIESVNTSQDAAIAAKIGDAPNDGKEYVRKSLAWAVASSSPGPAFYGYASTPTVAASGPTKVELEAELFDTDGCFAGGRFTPNVPGYYQFSFSVQMAVQASFRGALAKNGAIAAWGSQAGDVTVSSCGSALLYINGTTDYAELFAIFASVGGTAVEGKEVTYLCGHLARRS